MGVPEPVGVATSSRFIENIGEEGLVIFYAQKRQKCQTRKREEATPQYG